MVLGHLIACLHTAEAELLLSTLGLLPRHEARGAEPPPALAEAATAPAGARQGGGVKVHVGKTIAVIHHILQRILQLLLLCII